VGNKLFGCGMVLAAAVSVTAAVQMASVSAAAQDQPPGDWSFSLGAATLYAPDYKGRRVAGICGTA
jgi:outer membrane scaffolding protein for murein synthesis (MipA/OmpV family)